MDTPWPRLKEYMNLLGSLKYHTSKEHADQANIASVSNKLREFYLYVKQVGQRFNLTTCVFLFFNFLNCKVQERLEKRHRLVKLQKTVLDCPVIYPFSNRVT